MTEQQIRQALQGRSLRQVARETGLNRATVRMFAKGASRYQVGTLAALREYLK